MGGLRSGSGLHRAWLFAAALALVVRLIIPAGFMVGPSKTFQLIVCTGHGAALVHTATPGPAKTPKTENHSCVFSGAPLATEAASASAPPVKMRWAAAPIPVLQLSLTPGRGLAAPPPPSQGPPAFQA